MNKKLCFFCPGLCGGLPFHSACYRWGPAYKNSQPCNLCSSLISITLLCCWFGEFVRSSWLTLPFFWQSTPSSRPARARHQPNMRSWGRLSYLGQKLYLWMDIVVEIKPFYLKKIGAGSILHQLLLRPCDCHKSIVTDLNLADMVNHHWWSWRTMWILENYTWGAESREGYQAGLFHLQPALPPGTWISFTVTSL